MLSTNSNWVILSKANYNLVGLQAYSNSKYMLFALDDVTKKKESIGQGQQRYVTVKFP